MYHRGPHAMAEWGRKIHTGGQEDDQYNHGSHWVPKPAMDHVLPICGILVKQDSKSRPKLEILPWGMHRSYTPDISALLIFSFYEWVYYLESETPFPNSREKAGWFIGIAENVGDALTFWILTEDTEKIIARSVVRTTEDPKTANQRIDQFQPSSKEPPTKVIGMKDMLPNITLPSIDPGQLLMGVPSQLNMQGSPRRPK